MILRKLSAIGAVSACFGLVLPVIGQQVLPGYDLLETQPGTSFAGTPYLGVPIGSYNFGGSIGLQGVGNADTIIQRLAPATPGSPTVPLMMDALQLESATPTTFGGGPLGYYFITLQSAMGGPASTGSMTINFTDDTFTSSLDVFFNVDFGALNGPIVYQGNLVLSNPGTPWGNVAPPNSVLINGANYQLNGVNNANDFWPLGAFTETEPGGAVHVVSDASVPEPSTYMAALLLAVGAFLPRRRTAT
jgi:hypothetical protein